MDFFEAQVRAKKRTSRLVLLFVVAVAGTVIGTYVAAVLFLHQADQKRREWDGGEYGPRAIVWWNPRLFGGVASLTLTVVGLATLYKWHQYSAGGHVVAETVGGRHVDPNTTDLNERRLFNVVEEMAIASGVAVPPVYVLDDEPTINAFAAGLTTSDAIVAVTRGTLEKLSRDELQGVIAHEFRHILNGDMRLNMRLTSLVFGILVIGLVGRGVLWTLGRTRTRGRGKGGIAGLAFLGIALVAIG
ncbi:MAG: M48 family metalloprotease, partial [Opitutaceae bacterium]|nr:M48 family metalloprotease [Opitutaceae bacterium]